MLVLGIPRGGVPVAAEVAKALGAELDVIVARKLGAPGQPELAIGAVTSNGGRFLNEEAIREPELPRNTSAKSPKQKWPRHTGASSEFRGGRPAARSRTGS